MNAYEQWIQWEQQANHPRFVKDDVVAVEIAYAKQSDVIWDYHGDFDPPETDSVIWLRHPNATHTPSIPLSESRILLGRNTASRSIVLSGELDGYSFKAPTNFPHGLGRQEEPDKSVMWPEIRKALLRQRHIMACDSYWHDTPSFSILPDCVVVSDLAGKDGFILRDIRLLRDGHYYLPAFSIPYVGREIAKKNRESFAVFWKKHWAKPLGKLKAELLLRYGLQMKSPNSQNFLIQLDEKFLPTGRLIVRDLTDTIFISPIAIRLGLKAEVEIENDRIIEESYSTDSAFMLRPYVSNSLWHMDSGPMAIDDVTKNRWVVAHNHAYVKHICNSLGIANCNRFVSDRDALPELFNELTRLDSNLMNEYTLRRGRPANH